jgi:uncharacterized integral membrane protein
MKIDRESLFDNLPAFGIFITFLIILFIAININIQSSPQDFWKVNIGEILVGLGTIILAFFTATLATATEREGKKQREMIIEEAQTERRRLRLKERLEGLYSPLMGLGSDFEHPETHMEYFKYQSSRGPGEVYVTMKRIRNIYSYLALSVLKDQLDGYYTQYHAINHMPNEQYLKNLRAQFVKDYDDIIKEYK